MTLALCALILAPQTVFNCDKILTMPNQEELKDIQEAQTDTPVAASDEPIELSEEARVALALYLDVMKSGKVTKQGTMIPPLNIHKLSRIAEVPPKLVAKSFDRLRVKTFIANDDEGALYIPDILEFEDWLRTEGAAID